MGRSAAAAAPVPPGRCRRTRLHRCRPHPAADLAVAEAHGRRHLARTRTANFCQRRRRFELEFRLRARAGDGACPVGTARRLAAGRRRLAIRPAGRGRRDDGRLELGRPLCQAVAGNRLARHRWRGSRRSRPGRQPVRRAGGGGGVGQLSRRDGDRRGIVSVAGAFPSRPGRVPGAAARGLPSRLLLCALLAQHPDRARHRAVHGRPPEPVHPAGGAAHALPRRLRRTRGSGQRRNRGVDPRPAP